MAYKDPQSSTCCDENKNNVDDNGIEEDEKPEEDDYGSTDGTEDPDGADEGDEENVSEGGGDDYDPVIYLTECIYKKPHQALTSILMTSFLTSHHCCTIGFHVLLPQLN